MARHSQEYPRVALTSGGSGSGATATASMLSYIDFGTTISEIFRVTENDPYGSGSTHNLAFRNISDASGSTDYGEAILPDRASNAPVWVHYRAGFPGYASDSSVFPYIFSEYATIGAQGDWLSSDGQQDKANVIYQQAEAILQTELDKLERQEGQTQPVEFITYGTTAVSIGIKGTNIMASEYRGLGLNGGIYINTYCGSRQVNSLRSKQQKTTVLAAQVSNITNLDDICTGQDATDAMLLELYSTEILQASI